MIKTGTVSLVEKKLRKQKTDIQRSVDLGKSEMHTKLMNAKEALVQSVPTLNHSSPTYHTNLQSSTYIDTVNLAPDSSEKSAP